MPQLVIDARGRIVVAYSVFRDDDWNAQVLVSTSQDGGQRFSAPRAIGANPASQRFPALAFAPDGALFAAWIDKRLVAEAAKQGRKPKGASIAYAWSDDGGSTFSAPAIAHAESCECCRIGAAVPARDRPVIAFRAVYGQQVRDHALLAFDARSVPGALRRVADDNWVTDACPHHGPSLAVDGHGTMHVAWYTQGRARSGTFYARSADGGKRFSTPMAIGRDEQRSGRPYLLAAATTVWMTWKEFDGETSTVHGRISQDSGETWSAAVELARTRGYSHHPMLTRRDGRTYLSWLTHDEGYRLVPLR
ncbi:MAG: exo-alpha-sialidase [Gammaproteobacteria bacterium]|nr:exo-alpha-sialidase [Gammaproteobacteria bacterium]